jgi:serine/threonine protein kinase
MGEVWKALDRRKQETKDSDPYVAIKLINKKLKEFENSIIGLQREAKKAQKLAHPNVATVFDFDRDGEDAFISMELLNGAPLSELLKQHPQGLETNKGKHIISEIARGLAYAHKKGIVHSDLKPQNIFVCDDDSVKILDFGIARAFDSGENNTTIEGTIFNPADWNAITPSYASPEMFLLEDADPRDDIFALGCVSFQILSGKHPFDKVPSIQLDKGKIFLPKISNVGKKIESLLKRSVALNRDDRIENADEFLENFLLAESDQSTQKKPLILVFFFGFLSVSLVLLILVLNSNTVHQERLIEETYWNKPPQALSDQDTLKVQRLLKVASAHASIGRYLEPPSANAAETYMAVLRVQPGNKIAVSESEKIAQYVIEKAEKMHRDGEKEKALDALLTALDKLPEHPSIKAAVVRLEAE